MGNAYDLAALVALGSGAMLLFICLTCGLGGYCLPFVPVIAGLIALTSASRAADPERTRLHAWLGIGAGGLYIVLTLAALVIYVAAIVLFMASGSQ
jgi:hypothetical protein